MKIKLLFLIPLFFSTPSISNTAWDEGSAISEPSTDEGHYLPHISAKISKDPKGKKTVVFYFHPKITTDTCPYVMEIEPHERVLLDINDSYIHAVYYCRKYTKENGFYHLVASDNYTGKVYLEESFKKPGFTKIKLNDQTYIISNDGFNAAWDAY